MNVLLGGILLVVAVLIAVAAGFMGRPWRAGAGSPAGGGHVGRRRWPGVLFTDAVLIFAVGLVLLLE